MPALPKGDPAPVDGVLPEGLDWDRPLRAYVHVPFCSSRCGYCDFNTYTASELGGFAFPAYVEAVHSEIALAKQVVQPRPLASVFIGGGTPSLLPIKDLAAVLGALREAFGLEPGAEISLEANPEDVTQHALEGWLQAGVTRLSLGMQSADPQALGLLQRAHSPGSAVNAAALARTEGFQHVSLDLIYGIPGQSMDSWRATLVSALSAQPDHISAYALGVEPGTALERQVRRAEVSAPDPDTAAAQYDLADVVLSESGFAWYEISNWARPAGRCEHNLGYWRGDNWWGFGPGAHSHVDGVRWWNVKRPATYQGTLAARHSPAAARESLDGTSRHVESVMLQVRMADGIPRDAFPHATTERLLYDGLLENTDGARLRLTRKGRMLADAVVRVLLGWD
jgi:oxygen-independent coproporphyrinogen-3 oxidase